MTTIILHGGETSRDNVNNDRFWAQFTSSVAKKSVTVALIYWARNPQKWPTVIAHDQAKIIEQANGKKITFIIINKFQDLNLNLDRIDVIYFSGGDFEYVDAYKSDVGKLKPVINGKVFIGSSLGAFIASRYFISSFEDQNQSIQTGLSFLPIGVLCHWDKEDKQKAKLRSLKKVAPKLPILTLNETEFTTIFI